jgi:HK97 family phage major capsid protein
MDIAKFRETFAATKTEYQALLEKRVSENREYSADEKTAQDGRMAAMTRIQADIEEASKFAKLQLEQGDVIAPREPAGKQEFQNSQNSKPTDGKLSRDEFSRELNAWASSGERSRQFATITTGTGSGVLLPSSVIQPVSFQLQNRFRAAMAAYGLSAINTPTAEEIKIPIITSVGSGAVSESATSETDSQTTVDGIVLRPSTFESGSAWISKLALASNAFNLLGYIEESLELAKEQNLETAIVDAIVADSGIDDETNAIGSELTYQDLVNWNNSLPRRYDRLKAMIVSKSLFTLMEGMTDSVGRPVLVLDPQNGNLVRFNGTPVMWVDNFGDDTYGVSGAIFSLLGFKLRDVSQREIERYVQSSKSGQVGINLLSYHAFGWDPNAVMKIMG